jgi:hypothetical protein
MLKRGNEQQPFFYSTENKLCHNRICYPDILSQTHLVNNHKYVVMEKGY